MLAISIPGPFEIVFLLLFAAVILGIVLWAVRRTGKPDRGFEVTRDEKE